MINCAIPAISEIPDDYVPSNYDELYEVYAPFVTRLVTRYNRVHANFEDLLQHVWMEVLRVNLIQKYNTSTGTLPKRMTALQVCAFLGIPWGTFKIGNVRAKSGDIRRKKKSEFIWAPEALEREIYLRDNGVCHSCGMDTKILTTFFEDHWENSNKGAYALQMGRIGLPSDHRTWSYVGLDESIAFNRNDTFKVRYKVFCAACVVSNFSSIPTARVKPEKNCMKYLVPVVGTHASKKAQYAREDVLRFKQFRDKNTRCKKTQGVMPEVAQSKANFKPYLARSVHNIYANWCRTRKRRYKEHFPGVDLETGRSWEDALVDPCGPRQENLLELNEIISQFFDGREELIASRKEELLSLVAKGLTPEEIVSRMKLPKHVLKKLTRSR